MLTFFQRTARSQRLVSAMGPYYVWDGCGMASPGRVVSAALLGRRGQQVHQVALDRSGGKIPPRRSIERSLLEIGSAFWIW